VERRRCGVEELFLQRFDIREDMTIVDNSRTVDAYGPGDRHVTFLPSVAIVRVVTRSDVTGLWGFVEMTRWELSLESNQ
jgi:hypothetical protein